MSVENRVIKAPISIKDPYLALGVGSYNGMWDLAYINSNLHGKTNPWSLFKPVIYDSPIEIPVNVRKTITGFYTEQSEMGIFKITLIKPYLTISGFKRLNDWDGYNHNAKAFKGYVVKNDFTGAPPNTDVYIEEGNEGVFDVKITMPEINIYRFDTGVGDKGLVEVVSYDNNMRTQLGKIELYNVSDDDYGKVYANKDITLQCKINAAHVDPGQLFAMKIYTSVNSGMFFSPSYNEMIINVYKRFEQNPNNPDQWITAEVLLDLSNSPVAGSDPNRYIKYTSFKYLMHKGSDDLIGFEVKDLWHGFSGGQAAIYYQDAVSLEYKLMMTIPMEINNTFEWQLYNNAYYWSNIAYTSTHQYDFDDGTRAVTCANATVITPNAISNNRFKIGYVR